MTDNRPQLLRNERQQAIGRLKAGQNKHIIANAFNVKIRKIYHLKEQLRTTNSGDIHHLCTKSDPELPRFAKINKSASFAKINT